MIESVMASFPLTPSLPCNTLFIVNTFSYVLSSYFTVKVTFAISSASSVKVKVLLLSSNEPLHPKHTYVILHLSETSFSPLITESLQPQPSNELGVPLLSQGTPIYSRDNSTLTGAFASFEYPEIVKVDPSQTNAPLPKLNVPSDKIFTPLSPPI